ncbi:MAG: S26 family signal peptidase, partial [Spirochaetaceae bacterium]|nr:S26 family signal peptidase [Spirochaetaceae bacterium]
MKTEIETDFLDRLQTWTEILLTHRARRLEKKKRKQKARGIVMEWLDAFLWAVMVVLLLNQYLLQAYQIPSGSMRNTLIGGVDPYTNRPSSSDRIFVDKITFGPELLPGVGKLPGFRESRRGEVIIFENPEYSSPSLGHEIAQRVLYMVSLSLIDLNRIRSGEIAHQFLIKRQVAVDGDRVFFRRGELYLQPRGEANVILESDFKAFTGLEYGNHLLLDPSYYDKNAAKLEVMFLERAGLPVDRETADTAGSNWVSPLRIPVGDG